MSDTPATAAPTAPAVETTSTQAANPAPAAPSAASQDANDPFWLNERLSRTARQTLKAAGIDVPKNADPLEVAKEVAKKTEERKGERKRLREELVTAKAEAEQFKAQQSAHIEVLKSFATIELSKLPEAMQSMVRVIAKDDYAEQLKAISLLRAHAPAAAAVAAPAATPAATPDAAAKPLPAMASTSPATSAPAVGGPSAPEDYVATYKELKRSNPLLAAQYLDWNLPRIFPDRFLG